LKPVIEQVFRQRLWDICPDRLMPMDWNESTRRWIELRRIEQLLIQRMRWEFTKVYYWMIPTRTQLGRTGHKMWRGSFRLYQISSIDEERP